MKMPSKIFVKWETFQNDDPALTASATKSKLAEQDETVTVGEYRLVRTSKISMKVVETDPENFSS